MTLGKTAAASGKIEFALVGGCSIAETTGASSQPLFVVRLTLPVTIEDLERAGISARPATADELYSAGYVSIEELPTELREAIKAWRTPR